MLVVSGGVCVWGLRSHGRVKLKMFENSGLALRFLFFVVVHKPLVSKPLVSEPRVSKPLVSTC